MPAPKPTEEHRRDGTYQKCRHGDRADVLFEQGRPQMPPGLDGQSRWLWNYVCDHVPEKVISPADLPALIHVCRWWTLWREYDRQIEEGEGDPYKLLVMAATASKKVTEGLAKFGLSPRDRSGLKVIETTGEQADPLAELLKRRQNPN